jgi:transcriptional regulator with XRE-family HTH domain
MPKTTDAVEILRRRLNTNPEFEQMVAEERAKSVAAQAIYDVRTAAGLTQAELARKIGTKQSVIARLEDGDYEGHTYRILNRIAVALDQDVDIRFVPRAPKAAGAPRRQTYQAAKAR